MTLGVLLAHVAARWAVTREAPTSGWVPDESEIEMNTQEFLGRCVKPDIFHQTYEEATA